MIVTFASLMPGKPHHGQGFYFDGEYKGYIGTDADGVPFVCYKRPGFGKGVYEFHATIRACYHAVRCLATRLAWKDSWRVERILGSCNPARPASTLTAVARCLAPLYRKVDGELPSQYLQRVLSTRVPTADSPRSVPALARDVVRSVPVALSITTDRALFFGNATYQQPLTARNT